MVGDNLHPAGNDQVSLPKTLLSRWFSIFKGGTGDQMGMVGDNL